MGINESVPRSSLLSDGTRNDQGEEWNASRNDDGTVSVKALLQRLDERSKRNEVRNGDGTDPKTPVPRLWTPFRKVAHLTDEQAVGVVMRELERPQWSAAEWRHVYEERAAIFEHEQGLAHDDAEFRAYLHCLHQWLLRNPPGYRPDLKCLSCGEMTEKSDVAVMCADRLQRWLHPVCADGYRLLRTRDAILGLEVLGIVDPTLAIAKKVADNLAKSEAA